jgi:hypothetical protein
MSKQPQRVQNMQSEFSDVLKQTKLSPLARELPWTHNTIIFSHFERTMLGNQKLSAVLRETHPSIDHTRKDNCCFG